MEEIIIRVPETIGQNGFWETRNQLNLFVRKYFDALYEGAVRLGCNIPADYWAPRRVQVNYTRLHRCVGLKYASGHKYNDDCPPTKQQLIETINDIQRLLDAAAENIEAPFELIIKEPDKKG